MFKIIMFRLLFIKLLLNIIFLDQVILAINQDYNSKVKVKQNDIYCLLSNYLLT